MEACKKYFSNSVIILFIRELVESRQEFGFIANYKL